MYTDNGIIVTMEDGELRILETGVSRAQADEVIRRRDREGQPPAGFFAVEETSARLVLSVVNESRTIDQLVAAD